MEMNNEMINEHNQMIEEASNKFKELTTLDGRVLEIKSNFNKLLVIPYKGNPYAKLDEQNGIFIGDAESMNYKSEKDTDSGERYDLDRGIVVCEVISANPGSHIKEGDDIFIHVSNLDPIPFLNKNIRCCYESNVYAIVGFDLTKRMENKLIG